MSLLFLEMCCIGFLPSVVSLGCEFKRTSCLDVPLSFSFLSYVGLCILTEIRLLIVLQKLILCERTGFVKSDED